MDPGTLSANEITINSRVVWPVIHTMFYLLVFKVFTRSETETILTKTFKWPWYVYIIGIYV